MVKFKIVKHMHKYHVIVYMGVKNPRTKGKKSTYNEQCISSHYTLKKAKKALDNYKQTGLKLSSKIEYTLYYRIKKELPLAVTLAIVGAVFVEILIILKG